LPGEDAWCFQAVERSGEEFLIGRKDPSVSTAADLAG
jgi:hypothetical protein